MNKKNTIISLIVLVVVGSIMAFYMNNLILSDISNSFYGLHDYNIISSIPGFIFAWMFVLATFFVIRLYKYPKSKKRLINLYTILLAILALIGFIFSILTGISIYHSFVSPYPFFGYTIIFLLVHLGLLVLAIYLNILARKKLPEDEEKRKIGLLYVIYTIVCTIAMFFAYNRFGAFLLSCIYISYPSLYMTFVFYLTLLLPISLMFYVMAKIFGLCRNKPRIALIILLSIFAANIIFNLASILIGRNNTLFISAISPALAIERLLTKPIDIIAQFIFVTIFTICYLVSYFITQKKKNNAN